MKQGKTLQELAVEIERQHNVKHDYIAETKAITMTPDAKRFEIAKVGDFGINDFARKQLAEKLNIPLAYFQRLSENHPDLLAQNVNTLMQREPQRTMVRTLDGNVRALLSDRYRPLDNFDLLNALLPVVFEMGDRVQVESCEATDTRMYLKLLMPQLDRELPVPEGLKMGVGHNWFIRKIIGAVTVGNSEVGSGSLYVAPGMFEKQCTNLAIFRDEGFAKLHVGRKAAGDDAAFKYLTDQTKRLEDATVFARLLDVFKATMDGRVMDAIVKQLEVARGDVIDVDPSGVVEVFAKKNSLNETEKGGLLRHFVNSGEMNRYGLQWAVTRLANDVDDYDRSTELERLGGQVIELPQNDWRALLKAA